MAKIRNIRKELREKGAAVVIVASYGTFSTGISIKNIHNIFLTESFKSDTIIRQSIGRGLRKLAGKDTVKIVDFVDDFHMFFNVICAIINAYSISLGAKVSF